KLLSLRESSAASLDLGSRLLQPSRGRRSRELCARHTRGFQNALLIRRKPLQVAFDHLADVAGHLDLLRIGQRSLIEQVLDHIHHEQRITLGPRIEHGSYVLSVVAESFRQKSSYVGFAKKWQSQFDSMLVKFQLLLHRSQRMLSR